MQKNPQACGAPYRFKWTNNTSSTRLQHWPALAWPYTSSTENAVIHDIKMMYLHTEQNW